MGYGEVNLNEMIAEVRPKCPHYEEDCEWELEMWAPLKITGFEVKLCQNCRAHVERRPQDIFVEMLSAKLGVPKDSGFMFNQMADVLAEIDAKRLYDIREDTPQEVKDG